MDLGNPRKAGEQFLRLIDIMRRLRAPDGCPWDREQTFDSIKPYTLEETYEVLDAIDARDWPGLAEELGDYMLQAVFYSQMAEEAGHFTIEDALTAINEKLVRRHPHVFAEGSARTADQVKARWDEIKKTEKKDDASKLLLDRVPRSTPALVEAAQISAKAAGAGFDWDSAEQVLAKLEEELRELAEARTGASQAEIEDEIGDILFVLVNLARWVKVDPEQALRRSNAKFRRRFAHVETALRERGRSLADSNIEEMESLWQQAKQSEA
jgi:MazG family protein